MPETEAHIGEYPFIVRVVDSNNIAQSQQFSIKVAVPVVEEETEEEVTIEGLEEIS